jgi:hypothetical protein
MHGEPTPSAFLDAMLRLSELASLLLGGRLG